MARGFTTGDEIGARISKLRQALDLTVPELSRRIGVTPDALQRLLRGESTAQYIKLIQIARVLNTTPNTILGFNDPDVIRATLEACFDALGLPEDQASLLAETVEQVLEQPEVPGLDPATQARSQAPLLLRQLSKSRRPK
jgi:transcriptional regulator with XRE-family HTH domain